MSINGSQIYDGVTSRLIKFSNVVNVPKPIKDSDGNIVDLEYADKNLQPFSPENLLDQLDVPISASRNLNYPDTEVKYTSIEAISKSVSDEIENQIKTNMVLDDISDVDVSNVNNKDLLVYEDGGWINTSADHSYLINLSADDHPQYHNDTRGDARYYTKSEVYNNTEIDQQRGVLESEIYMLISATGISAVGSTISHHSLSNLNSYDDHPQYHNDTRGDARYYTKSEFIAGSVPLIENGIGGTNILTTNSVSAAFKQIETTDSRQNDTGFYSWGGAGNYYSVAGTTFNLLRPGTGYIKGKEINWIATQSISIGTANTLYYIGIDVNGTIQAISTITEQTFYDNVMLFEVLYDGTNVVVVKENHPYAFDSDASRFLHNNLGIIIRNASQGANITKIGTGTGGSTSDRQIKIVGGDILEDHGIQTTISDTGGSAMTFNDYYTNSSGKWIRRYSGTEVACVWNNAGTITNAGNGNFTVKRVYVSKDDLNSSTPTYYYVIHTSMFNNLAQARTGITNGVARATNELAGLELCQLGYLIIGQNGGNAYIAEVQIQKSVLSGATTGNGATNLANLVSVNTTNFNGILSSSDTTVQNALDTVDDHRHFELYDSTKVNVALTSNSSSEVGLGSTPSAGYKLAIINGGSGNGLSGMLNVSNRTDSDVIISVSQVGATNKYALIQPSVNVPLAICGTVGRVVIGDVVNTYTMLKVIQNASDASVFAAAEFVTTKSTGTNNALNLLSRVSSTGTNCGLYLDVRSAATANWAIYAEYGNTYLSQAVAIGTTSVSKLLTIKDSTTAQISLDHSTTEKTRLMGWVEGQFYINMGCDYSAPPGLGWVRTNGLAAGKQTHCYFGNSYIQLGVRTKTLSGEQITAFELAGLHIVPGTGIGIDNENPLGKLDIRGGGGSTGVGDQYNILFQYKDGGYRHRIRSRHNGTSGAGNAIDFFVWNYGVDDITTGIGTLHCLTLDNGHVAIGSQTADANHPLSITGTYGAIIATSTANYGYSGFLGFNDVGKYFHILAYGSAFGGTTLGVSNNNMSNLQTVESSSLCIRTYTASAGRIPIYIGQTASGIDEAVITIDTSGITNIKNGINLGGSTLSKYKKGTFKVKGYALTGDIDYSYGGGANCSYVIIGDVVYLTFEEINSNTFFGNGSIYTGPVYMYNFPAELIPATAASFDLWIYDGSSINLQVISLLSTGKGYISNSGGEAFHNFVTGAGYNTTFKQSIAAAKQTVVYRLV